MPSSLTLSSPSGNASITVDCVYGGRLSSLVLDDRELLIRSAVSPLDWGLYPMVPFAGRVQNGLLRFDDDITQLPANNGPHAIHGYGFIREWTPIDESSIEFEFGEPWPFAGRAVQRFELADDSLTCVLRVEAVDRQPMQIGWHPWFRRDIGVGENVALEFEAEAMFVRGDDGIPTGELITPPLGPWDDCFDGVNTNPKVSWGDIELTLSSGLQQWTVFNEHPDGICVEPQLGPPNNVNSDPIIMEAGDVIEEQFTISWS